jgi:hypothetical protein
MPPPSINLPSDFLDAIDALRERPADPAAREFLRLVRIGGRWSPWLQLRTARRLHTRLPDGDVLQIVLAGFHSRRLQHLGTALATIASPAHAR